MRREGGKAVLDRCELLSIDPAAGPDGRSAALRGAALPRVPVSAVLKPEDYQLALVEAPEVPPAELRAAMRWRLKDTIDFRIDDAVIDVFDVPEHNRGGHGRMMYAVAARRGAIDGYASALAGVPDFDVIDVPELCLRNLAALLPAAAAGVALLHLGDTSASIVLVRGRTFYFARHMDLHSQAGKGAILDPHARVDAAGVVLELQRSLDYYERHFDQPPITRIAVAPSGPRATALAQDLGTDTGFEVAHTRSQCAARVPHTDRARRPRRPACWPWAPHFARSTAPSEPPWNSKSISINPSWAPRSGCSRRAPSASVCSCSPCVSRAWGLRRLAHRARRAVDRRAREAQAEPACDGGARRRGAAARERASPSSTRKRKELSADIAARERALDIVRLGAASPGTGFAARLEALARRQLDGLWLHDDRAGGPATAGWPCAAPRPIRAWCPLISRHWPRSGRSPAFASTSSRCAAPARTRRPRRICSSSARAACAAGRGGAADDRACGVSAKCGH